jgi:hypothetical protein
MTVIVLYRIDATKHMHRFSANGAASAATANKLNFAACRITVEGRNVLRLECLK